MLQAAFLYKALNCETKKEMKRLKRMYGESVIDYRALEGKARGNSK